MIFGPITLGADLSLLSERTMSKSDSDMRPEYRRDALGKGVRGKDHARYTKGTNLVLLDDKVAPRPPRHPVLERRTQRQTPG